MEDSYVLQLFKTKVLKIFHFVFSADLQNASHYIAMDRPQDPIIFLHYVMKGKGIYQVGETKYQLKEGQAFLIEPESLTFYQADKKEPWSYLWVGFGGTEAQRFVRDLGLNSRQLTCECEYGKELEKIVFEMLQHTHSTVENLYYLQGKLYQFFSVLARGIEIQQYVDDTKESIHVQEAIAYIKNCYSKKITVEDIADYLAINRSYLYTIFKNNLGISPKDFLTEFRISRGKEQLTLTDLSVEEIAVSCGYRNSLAFGKVFKQKIGMTPTQYRNDNRKVARERLISAQNELERIQETIKKFNVGEVRKRIERNVRKRTSGT